MSITPAGGWGDSSSNNHQRRQDSIPSYPSSKSGSGVVVAGYICCFIALLFLPPAFALAGFVCGVVALTKDRVGHGVILVVLAVACGITGMFTGAITGMFLGSLTRNTATAPRSETEVIKVSAAALNAAYEANEVAADERYADKTLNVSGVISSIDKDAWGKVHVIMADRGLFSYGTLLGVNAAMNSDEDTASTASNLTRGQEIVVICKNVHRIVGSVMLSDCEFDLSTTQSTLGEEQQNQSGAYTVSPQSIEESNQNTEIHNLNIQPQAQITPDAQSDTRTAAPSDELSTSTPQPTTNNQPPAPTISPSGTIMVQIATVSSQDVADILLASLQKKGYSVSVRHEPQDKLLHVEIGPFATRQDAEAMQQRVIADGFNAIVK